MTGTRYESTSYLLPPTSYFLLLPHPDTVLLESRAGVRGYDGVLMDESPRETDISTSKMMDAKARL